VIVICLSVCSSLHFIVFLALGLLADYSIYTVVGKGKGLDTSYRLAPLIYMIKTRDQQRFTICECHEPTVPQRIMWPSIARANGQLDPRCS